MPTLSEIIAKTEADHTDVMHRIADLQDAFDRDIAKLRDEGLVLAKVLEALWAVQASTGAAPATAAQAFADEAPEPAKEEPRQMARNYEPPEVRPDPSPLPAAVEANGFDRASLKRQLRQWHIRYPLGISHRVPSQMMRQALRATLLDHEGYRADWLAKGGADFGDANLSYTLQDMRDAATILGIDADDVMNHAHKVQRLFWHYGVRGVDHNWEDAR